MPRSSSRNQTASRPSTATRKLPHSLHLSSTDLGIRRREARHRPDTSIGNSSRCQASSLPSTAHTGEPTRVRDLCTAACSDNQKITLAGSMSSRYTSDPSSTRSIGTLGEICGGTRQSRSGPSSRGTGESFDRAQRCGLVIGVY